LEFQDNTIHELINEYNNKFVKIYNKIINEKIYLLFKNECNDGLLKEITFDNIKKYSMIIMTRNIMLQKDNFFLIPLLDLFNTNLKEFSNIFFIKDNDKYIAATSRTIEKDEELFIHYMSLENQLSMITYGVCFENNPIQKENYVFTKDFIHQYIESLDLEKKRKIITFLQKNNLYNSYNIYLDYQIEYHQIKPSQFLKTLRIMVADESDFKNIILADASVSIENEKKMIKLLKLMFEDKLKNYPTSINDDDYILKNQKLSYDLKCIVVIRRDKKKILQNFINKIKL
jgi:hypothetical protein